MFTTLDTCREEIDQFFYVVRYRVTRFPIIPLLPFLQVTRNERRVSQLMSLSAKSEKYMSATPTLENYNDSDQPRLPLLCHLQYIQYKSNLATPHTTPHPALSHTITLIIMESESEIFFRTSIPTPTKCMTSPATPTVAYEIMKRRAIARS